jgi:talin
MLFVPVPCLLLPQTLQKPNPELKQQLTGHSKRVAGSVTELIQAAEAMKGEG